MIVTGSERRAGSKARPEMIRTILNSLTQIDTALANLDKTIRGIGERLNRRNKNSRWMNG